ncbi:MAG: IclR family transcriptional regulator [Alicyclobacillus shizuokensis]|nr:IclR family transcriptional regulator [Alicyclobacillus shizuokensis]
MLAVIRTMQLLDALVQAPDGMGVMELANALKIHKADVSRILSTLQDMGYVIQDERTDRFTVSFKFVAMALRYKDHTELEDIVQPVLAELVRQTGESVQFAVEQNRELIYVERMDGTKPLRVASMLGLSAPLHATAAGKVWLASLPTEEVVALMKERGMEAVTEHTITDLDALLRELAQVRQQGYAVSREEVNPTVFGLAVPVHDRKGMVRAAVVVTLPMYEATGERIDAVKSRAMKAAGILTEQLSLIW